MNDKHPDVYPADFIKDGNDLTHLGKDQSKPALIILNQPIADTRVLDRLWNHTSYRLCADGGANQLHDLFVLNDPSRLDQYLPDIVHGDLDSLRDDVKAHYQGRGVEVTQDPDQYSTDFGKAIKQVLREQPWQRNFLVLGTIAGRLDQGIGLLSEIYREQHSKECPNLRFWLFSESSISFTLPAGTTTIHTPLAEKVITPNIGILPIFGPAHISTNGLEWDVKDWYTQMGGQVSTSNHIVKDQITVSTDAEVLFTVERRKSVAG
ncbi:thiamine pyrophosphokinase [Aureobasidium subglaciale]|nr:thiamine pyrophosphokinase [Aureobasidium subglaciale]